MDTFTIVYHILQVLGLIMPVIFYGYKFYKAVQDERTKKSEPSVSIRLAHLDEADVDVNVSVRNSKK